LPITESPLNNAFGLISLTLVNRKLSNDGRYSVSLYENLKEEEYFL